MLLTPTLTDHNPTLLLRTLGGLELMGTSFTRPKPLLLLAYLALEGPQDRRHLAELFWPEAADHMKSLTVALAQLRQGAAGAIEADNQRCWVSLQTDAQGFLLKLDQGDLELALNSYGAPFLRGFHLPELGVELEEWTLKTREYLAGRARQAMLSLAEKEAAQSQFATAAKRAEDAYILSGAAEPEAEELVRIYPLLLAGDNPHAAEVRRELESLGYEVELLDSPAAARERLSRATPVRRQSPLPTRNTPFLGRKQDQQQLKDLLLSQRLISVVGPAGVGKTRLALQLAQELQAGDTFSGGVFFVDLDVLENPEHLTQHIATSLQVEVKANQEAFQALAYGIADQAMLLVLDNFELLIELAPPLSDLLRVCPNLRILATSRERLGLEEEQVFMLASLRYPHDEAVLLEEAQRFFSVQLFVDRAKRAKADFELREADLGAVVQICRAVDGLPLGLELAAAWVRAMPLQEIAAELSQNLDLLSSTARNVPERHRSIRTAFEYSWKLLSAKEQEVLRKLSVFRGGFRREAASEVAGATIPILASLVDKSLLRLDPQGRYHRHPLVYALTKEKLAEVSDIHNQTREKHARYFAQVLQAVKSHLSSPKHAEGMGRIAEELENVRLAWGWMVQSAEWGLLEEALGVVCQFFDRRSRHCESQELLQQALGSMPDGHPLRGRVLADAAWSQHRMGNDERATALAKEAIALLPAQSSSALSSLNVLASIAWKRGDYAEARGRWHQALQQCEAQGHTRGIGRFLGNLAIAEIALGNSDLAREQLRRSLEIAQSIHDHLTIPQNHNRLGNLEFDQQNFEAARALWTKGLAYAKQHGVENIIPMLIHNLGRLAIEHGDYDQANALFKESLEGSRNAGDHRLQSLNLTYLGKAASSKGEPESAQSLLAQALSVAHSAQTIPAFLKATLVLAELKVQQGMLEVAAPLLHLVSGHSTTEWKDREQARQMLGAIDAAGVERVMSLEEVLEVAGANGVHPSQSALV